MKLQRARSNKQLDTAFVVEGLRGLVKDNVEEVDLREFMSAFDTYRRKNLTLAAAALAALITTNHKMLQQLRDRIELLESEARAVYRGVFEEGEQYERGDMVSRQGGLWHCQVPTSDVPGGGSLCWRLCVKRGRGG